MQEAEQSYEWTYTFSKRIKENNGMGQVHFCEAESKINWKDACIGNFCDINGAVGTPV